MAGFLTSHYPEPVDPDGLLITNGNSQALDFICTRFTKPGDTILVEAPSYFLALKIFADHGLRPVSIPMDGQGLCTDILEKQLKVLTPAFLYTIPTHHNPAGVTLSDERRESLAAICKKHDLLLVADEVYHFLTFSDELPIPFCTYADQAPVVSLGSFSKILAPGLRLGWIQAAPDLINKLVRSGVMVSGGGFNPFTSQVVNEFVQTGQLEKNIKKLNGIFKKRMSVLAGQLQTQLPETIQFDKPGGGYFIWGRLPGDMDAAKLRKTAQEQGVDFFPGTLFSSDGGLPNFIRLAFCFYDEPMLIKGVTRLAKIFI